MAKPKIFVSHSSLDTAFAMMLVGDLNAAGAEAWMDVNDLGAGNFQKGIDEALGDCEWFLLVLTPNALASDWVRMEVDAAIRLKNMRKIRELIFIKAADLDHKDLPALWGVFNTFDATANYASALTRTLEAVSIAAKTPSAAPLSSPHGHEDRYAYAYNVMRFTMRHKSNFLHFMSRHKKLADREIASMNCPYCHHICMLDLGPSTGVIPLSIVKHEDLRVTCDYCGKYFLYST